MYKRQNQEQAPADQENKSQGREQEGDPQKNNGKNGAQKDGDEKDKDQNKKSDSTEKADDKKEEEEKKPMDPATKRRRIIIGVGVGIVVLVAGIAWWVYSLSLIHIYSGSRTRIPVAEPMCLLFDGDDSPILLPKIGMRRAGSKNEVIVFELRAVPEMRSAAVRVETCDLLHNDLNVWYAQD